MRESDKHWLKLLADSFLQLENSLYSMKIKDQGRAANDARPLILFWLVSFPVALTALLFIFDRV